MHIYIVNIIPVYIPATTVIIPLSISDQFNLHNEQGEKLKKQGDYYMTIQKFSIIQLSKAD